MMSASWEVMRVQIHFAHVHRCRRLGFHPSETCKLLVPRPQHQLHSVYLLCLMNYLKQNSTFSLKNIYFDYTTFVEHNYLYKDRCLDSSKPK